MLQSITRWLYSIRDIQRHNAYRTPNARGLQHPLCRLENEEGKDINHLKLGRRCTEKWHVMTLPPIYTLTGRQAEMASIDPLFFCFGSILFLYYFLIHSLRNDARFFFVLLFPTSLPSLYFTVLLSFFTVTSAKNKDKYCFPYVTIAGCAVYNIRSVNLLRKKKCILTKDAIR